MKLLLRRSSETSGVLGKKYTFVLDVRAEVTPEEQDLIQKCGMGSAALHYHEHNPNHAPESAIGSVYKRMKDTLLTVDGLVAGKSFTCKDVGEMMVTEDEVKRSSVMLKRYLEAAKEFGGEEVIDVTELAQDPKFA